MKLENKYYKLSENFNLNEFKVSKDYSDLAEKIEFKYEHILALKILCLECIQPIRNKFGIIDILSGLRSEALNNATGGSKNSDHLTGNAADLSIRNFNSEIVYKWIVKESNINYRQVIFYPEQCFIHISCNIPIKVEKHESMIYLKGKGYALFKEHYRND